MKILILASNPRKDLRLDHEIRDLKEVIERSQNREQFEVVDELAVRVKDLQELLFRHQPQIVHFCGHGSGKQGLVFETDTGGEQWVTTEALSDLFRLFSRSVGCVLLNACYSEAQAKAIVEHIDYVIGMNQEIQDNAAVAFATGFYLALSYNSSIEEAYEHGCTAIHLQITGSSTVRSGTEEETRRLKVMDAAVTTIIPEHLNPILKKREGASRRFLSQAAREELQQGLAQTFINSAPRDSLTQPEFNIAYITPPPQTSQNLSSLNAPRLRLTLFLLGCMVIGIIPVASIYGYQQWQQHQPERAALEQKEEPSSETDRNNQTPQEEQPKQQVPQPEPPPPVVPSPVPEPSASISWQNYQYAWLSERLVTEADLEGRTKLELDIMRNSLYAKYGYIFGEPDFQVEFSKELWYERKYGPGRKAAEYIFKEQMIDVERENVKILRDKAS